ncbi:acylphosphatase [Aquimarina intermedia]|uniref:acylphosphatase n=1 Tax=Aquimarina intermedia TaxID=350814 RepID=A0A5S5C5F6_9FLAO|nr:acylphosphatase [Aquimarina intermedia]TYP73560.1 acylphosphatase [Aquimarina intermedia]
MHYSITVSGKVQGVWYRKHTQEKATALGLKGYVKNQSNGSVYIEAEGSKEQLEELLTWCATGPELANVARIDHTEGTPKHFERFEIR